MKLGELARATSGAVVIGDETIDVSNLEYDSRQIVPGSAFFAVAGYRQDGNLFIPQAIKSGACAVIGERPPDGLPVAFVHVPDIRVAMADISAAFYGYPGKKLKVCGVTGTNGKTTTSYLIRSILQSRNKLTGLVTTQLYDTGTHQFPADRTTPDALDLQRLLFLMRTNRCVNAVVEVSSHALVLHRVDHINFRVAVFTNFTRDHLDFHQTMEEYFAAKASLIDRLDGELSYAVINLDEPAWKPLFGRVVSSYLTYSTRPSHLSHADVAVERFELLADRTLLDLTTPMGNATVSLALPGRFNLQNAVAAAAGGLACGVDLDAVVNGLEAAQPVPGRLNSINCGQPFAVYVDYAHTPDAITRLGETVRQLVSGRLLLLFGCGGDRDKGKRPQMGRAACSVADFVVVTSDNPRHESPDSIINDIRPGLSGSSWQVVADRREAIGKILSMARSGDAVVLAGKGAEPYQEINEQKFPFSDSEVATDHLQQLGYAGQATGVTR